MRNTLMITAVALALVSSSGFAQTPPAPASKAKVAPERGVVGGLKPVGVEMAERKASLRARAMLEIGAPCNLLPGDQLEKIDVTADGKVMARKLRFARAPAQAGLSGEVCPTAARIKTTAATWTALVAEKVAVDARAVAAGRKK